MIPNVLNTLLGIVLVYCAILAPDTLRANMHTVTLAGIAVVAFALWSRAGDELKWFSIVNAALGLALVLLGLAAVLMPIDPLVTFWWVFWVGIVVAVLALWSALYTQDTGSARAPR